MKVKKVSYIHKKIAKRLFLLSESFLVKESNETFLFRVMIEKAEISSRRYTKKYTVSY